MKSFILAASLASAFLMPGLAPAALAQQSSMSTPQQSRDAATVQVNNRAVFSLAATGGMSAEDRATLVKTRLRDAILPAPRAQFQPIGRNDISVHTVNGLPVLRVRDTDLFTVTRPDARLLGLSSPTQAAERFAGNLAKALDGFQLGRNASLPDNFIAVAPGVMSQPMASRPNGQTATNNRMNQNQEVAFAAVRVNDKEVLRLFDAGDLSAETRARMVRERINNVLQTGPNEPFQPIQASDVNVVRVNNMPVLRLRDANLITVTHRDAKLVGTDAQTLAQRWASDLRGALEGVRLGSGEAVPGDLVAISTGTMTIPTASMGGGAGTGEPNDMPNKGMQNQNNRHSGTD